MKILRMADGAPAGGGSTTATLATGTAVMDEAIKKMFPEDNRASQAPGGGEGGTTDLSKALNGEGAGEGTGAGEGGEGAAGEGAGEGTGAEEGGEGAAGEGAGEGTGAGEGGEGEKAVYQRLANRVGSLLQRLDAQQVELEELRAARASGGPVSLPEAVAKAVKMEELATLKEQTETNRDQVQGLLDQLAYDPEGVEAEVRQLVQANPSLANRFKKPGENGETVDDYSKGKMAKLLQEMKSNFNTTLNAIPKRQAFLTTKRQVSQLMREPEVIKAAPFVTDVDSEDYGHFRQLASLGANFPNGELLAAAATIGLKTLMPAIQAAGNRIQGKRAGAGAGGKGPSRLPNTAGAGAAAKAGGKKFQQLVQTAKEKPTLANINAMLDGA